MSKSTTRVRVARIAAGAVFAAGASLTAAGTAQALDIGVDLGIANVGVSLDEKGLGADVNAISGVDSGGSGNGGADDGGAGDDGGAEDGGNESGGPATTGGSGGADDGGAGDDGGSGDGGDDSAGPGTSGGNGDDGGSGDGGDDSAGPGTSGGNGDDGGAEDGGNESGGPATTGGNGGDDDTCVVDGEQVACDDASPATTGGGNDTEPIVDEQPKEELAETGSGPTTFLLVGAATMIAGGVGFRMLPRMLNRGAAA